MIVGLLPFFPPPLFIQQRVDAAPFCRRDDWSSPKAFLYSKTPSLYEQYAERLRTAGVYTVEDALAHLPKELFSHYTLKLRSRSSQAATGMSPRAIVYGNDAKIIVTFNGGEAGQRGRQRLEWMEFVDGGRRAELHAITLAGEGRAPHFSESNPAECTSCHGEDPRPIWSPYSQWPGAYGEHDDHLFLEDEREYALLKPTLKDHPRFRFLPQDEKNPVAPFDPDFKGSLDHRPNFNLLLLLSRWNARRLARRIEDSADSAILAPFFASLWSNCGRFPRESLGTLRSWLGFWVEPLTEGPSEYWPRREVSGQIAKHAGIGLEDWRMQLAENFDDPDAYVFDDGTAAMAALVADVLYGDLARQHPALSAAYATATYFDYEANKPESRRIDAMGGELKVDAKTVCPILQEQIYQALKARGLWGVSSVKD